MKLSTGKIILLIVCAVVIVICGKNLLKDTNGLINEIKNNTVVLEEAKLNDENEGKIILVSGKLECDEIKDNEFNVSVKSPLLRKDVQMYQYAVDENNEIYYEWSLPNEETMQDSEGYDILDARGYVLRNPKTNIESNTFKGTGKVGEINVDSNLLININVDTKNYEKEDTNSISCDGQKFYFVDGYFTTCRDEGRELVGDVRVRYTYKDISNVENVTVLAIQEGNKLVADKVGNTKVGQIVQGKVSLDTMLDKIEATEKSNKMGSLVVLIIAVVVLLLAFKKEKNNKVENKIANKNE